MLTAYPAAVLLDTVLGLAPCVLPAVLGYGGEVQRACRSHRPYQLQVRGITGDVLCARRVMSCTYSFWDIIDDLVMRKVNDSDATKFAEICR